MPTLKNTYRNKALTQIIAEINKVLCKIDTATIKETNQLLYSTTVVVTEELGYKIQSNRMSTQDTPPKNGKLDFNIKLTSGGWVPGASQEWHTVKQKNKSNTNKKYHLKSKTIKEVSEELKQRIPATAKKIERYDARIKQFRQNQSAEVLLKPYRNHGQPNRYA